MPEILEGQRLWKHDHRHMWMVECAVKSADGSGYAVVPADGQGRAHKEARFDRSHEHALYVTVPEDPQWVVEEE